MTVTISQPEDYFGEDIIGKTRLYKLLFLIMALKSLEKQNLAFIVYWHAFLLDL
jgi:hypothetical protein